LGIHRLWRLYYLVFQKPFLHCQQSWNCLQSG
jgi:hypothetical protein